jgi:hypothetical protein
MSKLMLCALLAIAPLESFPEVDRGAVSDGRNFDTIAQVAVETAQLLPKNKPDASPSPKVSRGVSRARVTAPSPTIKVVNARNFKPSALRSKYKNDAEQFAKANGCAAPVATMKVAVVGPESFESFAVACGPNAPMSIRCEPGRCRAM